MESPKQKKTLGVISLVAITVGTVASIRNLPTAALFGAQLIFFTIGGALLFLIPVALVSAELSSNWPERGGIYAWVKWHATANSIYLAYHDPKFIKRTTLARIDWCHGVI